MPLCHFHSFFDVFAFYSHFLKLPEYLALLRAIPDSRLLLPFPEASGIPRLTACHSGQW